MAAESGLLALTEIGPSSFHTAMISLRDGALKMETKNAWTPSLSPDGRWLAYTSNDAGRYQVYVRPTSGAEGRWQISMEGGVEPVWSASGSELFYRHGDQVLAVDVVTNSTSSTVGRACCSRAAMRSATSRTTHARMTSPPTAIDF
jgi:Tol biopolymer transport system component